MLSQQSNNPAIPKDDLVTSQIRQSAVNVLTHYSELAAHAIYFGESTARTQIRMLRYLADAKAPAKTPIYSKSSPQKAAHWTNNSSASENVSMDES